MSLYAFTTTEYLLLDGFLNERLESDIKFSLETSEDNFLIYIIKDRVAAIGLISEQKPFSHHFIYKIDIKHITEPDKRISVPFSLNSKPENKLSFTTDLSKKVLDLIYNSPYSFTYYLNNAEDIFVAEYAKSVKKEKKKPANKILSSNKNDSIYTNISEPHIKAQYILKKIADIIEYDAFLAKNDQGKSYNKEILGDGAITDIPYEHISKEAKNIISLIDVLWFKNSVPIAAFEIETTTSISSGLLRFSDLIFELNLPVELYIVTTRVRSKKLAKELNRSIFRSTGISQRCKVIFLDDLDILYQYVYSLKGYIKPNILDRISYNYSFFAQNK